MELETFTKAEPIVAEIRNLDKIIGKLETAEMKMGLMYWSGMTIMPSTQNAMLSSLALERGNLMEQLHKI